MTAESQDPLSTLQSTAVQPRPARWRVLWLPATIALGFAAVFAIVLAPALLPATPVTAIPAVSLAIETNPTNPTSTTTDHSANPDHPSDPSTPDRPATPPPPPADAPALFQAAGWVEPAPLPVHVTALVSGIVEQVHVIEGDPVEAGQLLATLVAEDAEIDLAAAEADLHEAEAMVQAARAEAEAAAAVATLRERQIEVATPQLDIARDRQQRLEAIQTGAIAESELVQARLDTARRQAELEAVRAEVPVARAEQRRAEAQVTLAGAKLEAATVTRDRAKLMLERTRIRAPLDGMVLRLNSAPGTKVMLDSDHPDSATVAVLYQPDQLQVRVDVPLNQVTSVRPGQAARIRSDLLPDQAMTGHVTSIGGEADIQRNSLQVKVRIDDPDPRLRPDMLCRVSFLDATVPGVSTAAADAAANSDAGKATPATATDAQAPDSSRRSVTAIMIPRAALVGDAAQTDQAEADVWVVDLDQRAEPRRVRLGPLERDGAVQVLEGVRAGEPVIIDPPAGLRSGRRLDVTIPTS